MVFASLATGVKNLWSREEQQFLLDHHKTMFIEDIAARLGRTVKATKCKACHMGCPFKSQPVEGNKV